MRMSNDRDQALLRSAVADHGADLFDFVPSLGTREAIAFGAGVPLPTRLTFPELPAHAIPKSASYATNAGIAGEHIEGDFISAVIDRWRKATMSQHGTHDEQPSFAPAAAPSAHADAPPLQPHQHAAAPSPIDATRLSLLKKPITAPLDNPLLRR